MSILSIKEDVKSIIIPYKQGLNIGDGLDPHYSVKKSALISSEIENKIDKSENFGKCFRELKKRTNNNYMML